jgi:DNA-binding NarL/FixJ family response regulator
MSPTASSKRTTVLLVDDRAWAREALAHTLEETDRHLRVLRVSTLSDLAGIQTPKGQTVILLNLIGIDSSDRLFYGRIEAIRLTKPGMPVVALSDRAQAEEILRAIGYGLNGYLLATLAGRHVARVLRFVATGGTFVPAEPFLADAEGAVPYGATADPPAGVPAPPAASISLTPRETEVLHLLRDGLTNKQVARALDLREPTVKVHVHNVLQKLGAANRTQLALLAEQTAPEKSTSS